MDVTMPRHSAEKNVDELLRVALQKEKRLDEELERLIESGRGKVEGLMEGMREGTGEALSDAMKKAEELAASTEETAKLADAVSYKIRVIDVKQSKVRAAIQRIDTISDRMKAVEGLKKALERDDVVSAVGCVGQFLDLDDNTLNASERDDSGAKDRIAYDEEMEGQRQILIKHRTSCVDQVRSKVQAAIKEGNQDDFKRYVQLFGPLRLEKEGVKIVIEHVTSLLGSKAQAQYDALVDGFTLTGAKVGYVDSLTELLRDVAQAIDEYLDLLRDAFGPDYALEAVHGFHAECDARGTRILHRYVDEKSLGKICSQIRNKVASTSKEDAIIEPRQVEPLLSELLLLCNRGEEYIQYVLEAMGDAAAPNAISPSLETSVRGGSMSSSLREVMSYYISLEEYYIEESVSKAIQIDEVVPGSLTSSMVDDAFYVLLASGKRALSTCRAPSAVAILNQVNTVVSTTYRSCLAQKLQGTPSRLAAYAPDTAGDAMVPEASNNAIGLNDVDLSSSYVDKLREQLERMASQVFTSPHDLDRVRMVLADLRKTAGDIQRLAEQASEQLTTSLMSHLRPHLDDFVSATYALSDTDNVNDSWALGLIQTFDLTFSWLRDVVTPATFDRVIDSAINIIISRMEAAVAHKQFTQLGGLQLEKDIRSLIVGLSEVTSKSMRDKFSRLQQTATVLGLETVSEASELVRDVAVSWRLTSLDIRQTLGLRVEFSQAQIAAVQLH